MKRILHCLIMGMSGFFCVFEIIMVFTNYPSLAFDHVWHPDATQAWPVNLLAACWWGFVLWSETKKRV